MTDPRQPATGTRASPRLFDRFSVGMYSAFLLWNWLLYAYGPAVQLLGADLGFSAAAIGLHGVALAVGTALAGVCLPVAVRALGRRGALLCGATTVALGAVGLTALSDLPGTMGATVVLALGGNLAIAAAQAGLVVHHTVNSAASVSTANGLGTLVGLFGPLLIGASVAVGWGWRPVVLVTVPVAIAVAVLWVRMPALPALTPRPTWTSPRGRGAATPASLTPETGAKAPDRTRNPLPAAGWWFLLAALMGVAIENATTFWALTLLVERTGAGAGLAAAAGAAFVAGMATSRLTSRVVTAGRSPATVVVGAFVVTVAGWLVLWLSTAPAVAMVGLALAGMGCGLLYPLSASLLLSTARGSTDAAQGVIMLAIGVAVGVVPFALGVLAGLFGVHTAFLLVPGLAAAGLAATRLGTRQMRGSPARAT
ncbi:MFS transporter [Georgenia muralis]|uniref:Fucose permease n=1 Tax=Georgenia muralis TaxID=154117 RepID=A0A3N4ZBV0_9MICO|nr:MFS transporter [Georgenia muralis]RPF28750.1 fucose permease [Georgenia muralis]